MHLLLRIFVALVASYVASGIYTEIYVINGGDDCMRRCLTNPQCMFIVYTKKDFTCITDSDDEDGYSNIKIMRPVLDNRTFQIEMYPNTSAVKSFRDTCMFDKREHKCIGPNVFTCHHVSEEVRLTAQWLCVEVKRLRVLYMCWSEGRGFNLTCRATVTWELLYPNRRRRVIMKKKQLAKTPLPKPRGRHNVITVCATPLVGTEFAIDLHKNRIVALHFNPRFYVEAKGFKPHLSINEVLFNFKTRMGWGPETYSKTFCFALHRPFMMVLVRRLGKHVITSGNCTWTFKDIFHKAPRQITVSYKELKVKQVDVR